MLNNLKIISLVIILISGCNLNNWSSDEILLNPQLNLSESNIGKGKSVNLVVLDERREINFGYKPSFSGISGKMGAPIKTNQNIREVFSASLIQGFKQKGFNINLEDNSKTNSLRAEIRYIRYFSTVFNYTESVQIKAGLMTYCTDVNGSLNYEKYFREEKYFPELWAALSEKENEKNFNDMISKLLEQVFKDQELLHCLAN